MSKKRPKYRGCFCWCCGQIRPNERFSGRGHARHLCRDCAKLDQAELEYRQHIRNIERTLDWDGRIRRRQRKVFERESYALSRYFDFLPQLEKIRRAADARADEGHFGR